MYGRSQRLSKHPKHSNLGTESHFEGSQVPVRSSGVMLWCGITKKKVAGPYCVEDGTVTVDHTNSCYQEKFFQLLGVSNENNLPRMLKPRHTEHQYVPIWTENEKITGLGDNSR